MDNNNKKEYDDFFRSRAHEHNDNDQTNESKAYESDVTGAKAEGPEDTYYYSYGSVRQEAQVTPPVAPAIEQQSLSHQPFYEQQPPYSPYGQSGSTGSVPSGGSNSFQVNKKKSSGSFG